MSATVQFRPTYRFMLSRALVVSGSILVVAVFVGAVTPAAKQGGVTPDVLDLLKFLSAEFLTGLALSAAAFFMIGALWPVITSAEGITCWNLSGQKRLIQWSEIGGVIPFTKLGIPMIQVKLTATSDFVSTAMYADRVEDVARFVAAHAPAGNPLAAWLKARSQDA